LAKEMAASNVRKRQNFQMNEREGDSVKFNVSIIDFVAEIGANK